MNKYIVHKYINVTYSAVIEAESEEEAEEISEQMDEEQFRTDWSDDFCEINLITELTDAYEYKRLPVIEYGTIKF